MNDEGFVFLIALADEGKGCRRYCAGNDRTPFDEPKCSSGRTGGRSYLYHG